MRFSDDFRGFEFLENCGVWVVETVICGVVRSWFWYFGEDFWRSSGMSAKWAVAYGVCLVCAQWAHKGLALEIVF